jgi:hypothetical protein
LLVGILVPRIVAHDLRLLDFGSFWYRFLAIAPVVVWLYVAITRKSKQPLQDFVLMGLVYGIVLAIAHQIFWNASFADMPPHLGGSLAGKLHPLLDSFVLRLAAIVSSLATGLATGVVFGIIAVAAKKLHR